MQHIVYVMDAPGNTFYGAKTAIYVFRITGPRLAAVPMKRLLAPFELAYRHCPLIGLLVSLPIHVLRRPATLGRKNVIFKRLSLGGYGVWWLSEERRAKSKTTVVSLSLSFISLHVMDGTWHVARNDDTDLLTISLPVI